MGKVTANLSMSLDGYITGPNDEVERLHEWMFPPKGNFQEIAGEMFENVGAVVMGRRMFNLGEEPWGDDPPFHMPVFVLTHQPRPKIVKEGGTTFTFVMEGIESALEQARAAAGDKDVLVAGGANAIQQYIRAGALDEIHVHLIPILLGEGTRLFEDLGAGPIELETANVADGPGVTHLTFRIAKQDTRPSTSLSNLSLGAPKVAPRIAVGLSATFLAILFLLHFLEPEFDPVWRMISEYALGRYGWMMVLAFFCWGGSVLALLVALWSSLRTMGGKIGRWWLLLIGIALFGAGIFKTNEITEPPASVANNLHALCGAIVILTFPIAASLVAGSLARNQAWAAERRRLVWGTLLVWFGLLAFFGSIIVSRAIHPSAGRVGPEVYLGWPNRFMVVVYHLWLIIVALHMARTTSQKITAVP